MNEREGGFEPFVLSGKTRLSQALKNIPGALEYIVSLNPHDFTRLHNPFMRKYMSPRISLQRVAAMAEVPLRQLLEGLSALKEGSVIEGLDDDGAASNSSADKSPVQAPQWMEGIAPQSLHQINVLPIDDVLGDPFPPISLGFKWMQPGEVVLLLHRWEPQPLYDIWQKMGLEWFTRQVSADEWHIYIHKPDSFPAPSPPAEVSVEVRHLDGNEIAPRTVALFEQLFEGQKIKITGFSDTDKTRILGAMQQSFAGKYEHQHTSDAAGKPTLYLLAKASRARAVTL